MKIIFFLFYFVSKSFSAANPCGYLYLTQSPSSKKYIQLNWYFNCPDPPDTILLTSEDPKINRDTKILHQVSTGSILKGHQDTKVSAKNLQFPGNWSQDFPNPDLGAKCFDFYISSVKNNEIVYSQCLAIQPAWMSSFGELRVGEMLIPGTHNSGAYKGGPPFIRNYFLNQDRTFWEQLVYGIRYFDIRIGRYDDGIYINHSFIKCTQLQPELESVANFLQKSPQEVVILNFYRFPHPKDFKRSHHLEIIDMIKKVFQGTIYPFHRNNNLKGPKLKDFWSSQQRVIISYREDQLLREQPWLWPSVRRAWGNVQKVEDLENYIKFVASRPLQGNPMHVVMAELTPSYSYFLQHPTTTLKTLSVMVNRELDVCLRENDRAKNLNIIASDFFTGNDVVNVALETNFRKLNHFFA